MVSARFRVEFPHNISTVGGCRECPLKPTLLIPYLDVPHTRAEKQFGTLGDDEHEPRLAAPPIHEREEAVFLENLQHGMPSGRGPT